jgi:hypothetical protein
MKKPKSQKIKYSSSLSVSSKLGFDVPLATALCKTFLLRMLNDC